MGPKPIVQLSFWLLFLRVDQSFSNETYFNNSFDQFGLAYKLVYVTFSCVLSNQILVNNVKCTKHITDFS